MSGKCLVGGRLKNLHLKGELSIKLLIALALVIITSSSLAEAAPINNENLDVQITAQEILTESQVEVPVVIEPVVEPVVVAQTAPKVTQPKPKPVVTGSWIEQCQIWASQAGVSLPSAAITLISRESKCNPTICNPNGLACGIPQALPFSKTGCELSVAGAVCQLQWMQSYVMNRYGSWESALAHSYANNWY